jgi:DMSO/TMAO reductase YedYZ molybdopterin-dependent catalytic subunit
MISTLKSPVTTIRAWVDATGFDSALVSKRNAFKTATKNTAMTGDLPLLPILAKIPLAAILPARIKILSNAKLVVVRGFDSAMRGSKVAFATVILIAARTKKNMM